MLFAMASRWSVSDSIPTAGMRPADFLRDRFIPRLKAADPQSGVNEAGDNLDPTRIWKIVMRNEKPGGTASGRSPSAFWTWRCGTRRLKSPKCRCTDFSPDRFRSGIVDEQSFCLRGRRLLLPGQGFAGASRGNVELPRHGLFRRQNENRRRAAFGRFGSH